MYPLRSQQSVDIVDIPLHNFVNTRQMRHHLPRLVYDETRTPRIREVLNTLRRHYLYKFHMPEFLSHPRQVQVDEVAKLIAVLVEVQNHK